jgi:hypothetical protein
MDAILDHPSNSGVVRSLCRKAGGNISVVAADAVHDPYLSCGSHPDIVERVWNQLGRELPPAARRILCGSPVLVHPDTGVVLAVCYGTSYCLRLPEGALSAALHAGCKTTHKWSNGKVTDLAVEFGANWVFGRWAVDEEQWCRTVAADAKNAA